MTGGSAALNTTKVWYADEVPVMLATDTVPLRRWAAPPESLDPAWSYETTGSGPPVLLVHDT